MEIRRYYHTEAMKLWEEINREESKRKAGLSDTEKAKEQAKIEKEVQDILRKCEQQSRETFRIVSPEKMATFTQLYERALWLAKVADMDISIKTEGVTGKIVLSTEYLIMNHYSPREMRTVIGELTEAADDVCYHAKDSLFYMEFTFDLYITV